MNTNGELISVRKYNYNFLSLNFRRVLYVVCFLLGNSFFIHLPLKMEPIEGSETSAFRTQTPGNYPKENTLHKEHSESLKSRKLV